MVKYPPTNAGDTRDAGSNPGLGRYPGERRGTHSSILAWRIPQTKEPGGLQSMESQKVRHNLRGLANSHIQGIVPDAI